MTVPFCVKPWDEIHFYNTGEVGVCCVSPTKALCLGNIHEDPKAVWFGKKARKLRKLILKNKKDKAGCAVCVDLSMGINQNSFTTTDHLLNLYHTEITHLPTRIYFQMSYTCNLHCHYCIQEWSKTNQRQHVTQPFPIDRFQAIANAFYPTALSFTFVGGEVFLDPSFHRMLTTLNPNMNPNCTIAIITNGTMIQRNLNTLAKFPKIHLRISLDATTQATYKKIRGANLMEVLVNAHRFLEYGKENNLDWTVSFNNIIMKSNIEELPNMIKFALEHEVSTSFGMVYGDLPNENIFLYPNLLEGVEWQSKINEAIRSLKEIHTPWAEEAQQTLKGIEAYLNSYDDSSWIQRVYRMNGCRYKEPKPPRFRRTKQMIARNYKLARRGEFRELARKVRSKL